ncbi:putative quinol monooxygenase [Roseateles cellulosilyticus]|uniref:Antibiotic biosynthesis monooxygenase n=1 Tax=Pelomonas cellulosilytica TaxID=2906762 RepID=A0ABS8XUV8_9BURK|nr:putative quinol monooxygenase [Pelomonas sp. P8]MCE4554406.1 antibiotic biosynthesis monooxygenase [Pelomonas sp. P8]
MIIVFGNVQIAPQHMEQARRVANEHVQRSRAEPGCISHAFYEDPERPSRLVFVEEWESAQALQQHFAVPASGAFVRQMEELAASPSHIKLYQATELPFPRAST